MVKKGVLQFILGNKFESRDAEKLRGYFGNIYRDEDLFHNHSKDGVIYRMPLIQYKVIGGILSIVSFNEGADVVGNKFLSVNHLRIGENEFKDFETGFSIKNEALKVVDELIEYSFESLWLPINQKNYLDYINGKLDLNRVLQNNILTIFKGLGIRAESRIMVNGKFKERSVYLNDIEHFGFTGNFVCNVIMPDYIGLGQKTSIGFGMVRRVEGGLG